jgi:transcriptional regulator with XRE-family HTH domain
MSIESSLRDQLRDVEYSEGYAESFLNAYVATQIKVIREQRQMTQADLARAIGTTQAGVSRIENVNYSSWSIRTLIKLARAFNVRLKVSFEPFGTLLDEVLHFDRANLQRAERKDDPGLYAPIIPVNVGKLLDWPKSKPPSLSGFEEGMPPTQLSPDLQKGVQGYGETRSAHG